MPESMPEMPMCLYGVIDRHLLNAVCSILMRCVGLHISLPLSKQFLAVMKTNCNIMHSFDFSISLKSACRSVDPSARPF